VASTSLALALPSSSSHAAAAETKATDLPSLPVPASSISVVGATAMSALAALVLAAQPDPGKVVPSKVDHHKAHLAKMSKEGEVHFTAEGRPRYLCSVDSCGKSFSRKEHYKRHLSLHFGDKLFACPTCGRAFNRPDNLRVHRATHVRKEEAAAIPGGDLDLDDFGSDNEIDANLEPGRVHIKTEEHTM